MAVRHSTAHTHLHVAAHDAFTSTIPSRESIVASADLHTKWRSRTEGIAKVAATLHFTCMTVDPGEAPGSEQAPRATRPAPPSAAPATNLPGAGPERSSADGEGSSAIQPAGHVFAGRSDGAVLAWVGRAVAGTGASHREGLLGWHSGPVLSCAYRRHALGPSRQGGMLATGGRDGSILIFDPVASDAQRRALDEAQEAVLLWLRGAAAHHYSVHSARQGAVSASSSTRFGPTTAGGLPTASKVARRAALDIAVQRGGVPAGAPATSRHESKALLQTLVRHRGGVEALAWTPGGLLLSGGGDGILTLWGCHRPSLDQARSALARGGGGVPEGEGGGSAPTPPLASGGGGGSAVVATYANSRSTAHACTAAFVPVQEWKLPESQVPTCLGTLGVDAGMVVLVGDTGGALHRFEQGTLQLQAPSEGGVSHAEWRRGAALDIATLQGGGGPADLLSGAPAARPDSSLSLSVRLPPWDHLLQRGGAPSRATSANPARPHHKHEMSAATAQAITALAPQAAAAAAAGGGKGGSPPPVDPAAAAALSETWVGVEPVTPTAWWRRLHHLRITAVVLLPETHHVVTLSADHTFKVTDFDSGAVLRTVTHPHLSASLPTTLSHAAAQVKGQPVNTAASRVNAAHSLHGLGGQTAAAAQAADARAAETAAGRSALSGKGASGAAGSKDGPGDLYSHHAMLHSSLGVSAAAARRAREEGRGVFVSATASALLPRVEAFLPDIRAGNPISSGVGQGGDIGDRTTRAAAAGGFLVGRVPEKAFEASSPFAAASAQGTAVRTDSHLSKAAHQRAILGAVRSGDSIASAMTRATAHATSAAGKADAFFPAYATPPRHGLGAAQARARAADRGSQLAMRSHGANMVSAVVNAAVAAHKTSAWRVAQEHSMGAGSALLGGTRARDGDGLGTAAPTLAGGSGGGGSGGASTAGREFVAEDFARVPLWAGSGEEGAEGTTWVRVAASVLGGTTGSSLLASCGVPLLDEATASDGRVELHRDPRFSVFSAALWDAGKRQLVLGDPLGRFYVWSVGDGAVLLEASLVPLDVADQMALLRQAHADRTDGRGAAAAATTFAAAKHHARTMRWWRDVDALRRVKCTPLPSPLVQSSAPLTPSDVDEGVQTGSGVDGERVQLPVKRPVFDFSAALSSRSGLSAASAVSGEAPAATIPAEDEDVADDALLARGGVYTAEDFGHHAFGIDRVRAEAARNKAAGGVGVGAAAQARSAALAAMTHADRADIPDDIMQQSVRKVRVAKFLATPKEGGAVPDSAGATSPARGEGASPRRGGGMTAAEEELLETELARLKSSASAFGSTLSGAGRWRVLSRTTTRLMRLAAERKNAVHRDAFTAMPYTPQGSLMRRMAPRVSAGWSSDEEEPGSDDPWLGAEFDARTDAESDAAAAAAGMDKDPAAFIAALDLSTGMPRWSPLALGLASLRVRGLVACPARYLPRLHSSSNQGAHDSAMGGGALDSGISDKVVSSTDSEQSDLLLCMGAVLCRLTVKQQQRTRSHRKHCEPVLHLGTAQLTHKRQARGTGAREHVRILTSVSSDGSVALWDSHSMQLWGRLVPPAPGVSTASGGAGNVGPHASVKAWLAKLSLDEAGPRAAAQGGPPGSSRSAAAASARGGSPAPPANTDRAPPDSPPRRPSARPDPSPTQDSPNATSVASHHRPGQHTAPLSSTRRMVVGLASAGASAVFGGSPTPLASPMRVEHVASAPALAPAPASGLDTPQSMRVSTGGSGAGPSPRRRKRMSVTFSSTSKGEEGREQSSWTGAAEEAEGGATSPGVRVVSGRSPGKEGVGAPPGPITLTDTPPPRTKRSKAPKRHLSLPGHGRGDPLGTPLPPTTPSHEAVPSGRLAAMLGATPRSVPTLLARSTLFKSFAAARLTPEEIVDALMSNPLTMQVLRQWGGGGGPVTPSAASGSQWASNISSRAALDLLAGPEGALAIATVLASGAGGSLGGSQRRGDAPPPSPPSSPQQPPTPKPQDAVRSGVAAVQVAPHLLHPGGRLERAGQYSGRSLTGSAREEFTHAADIVRDLLQPAAVHTQHTAWVRRNLRGVWAQAAATLQAMVALRPAEVPAAVSTHPVIRANAVTATASGEALPRLVAVAATDDIHRAALLTYSSRGEVTAAVVVPGTRPHIVIGYSSGQLLVWSLHRRRLVGVVSGLHCHPVTALALAQHAGRTLLVSADELGCVHLWDTSFVPNVALSHVAGHAAGVFRRRPPGTTEPDHPRPMFIPCMATYTPTPVQVYEAGGGVEQDGDAGGRGVQGGGGWTSPSLPSTPDYVSRAKVKERAAALRREAARRACVFLPGTDGIIRCVALASLTVQCEVDVGAALQEALAAALLVERAEAAKRLTPAQRAAAALQTRAKGARHRLRAKRERGNGGGAPSPPVSIVGLAVVGRLLVAATAGGALLGWDVHSAALPGAPAPRLLRFTRHALFPSGQPPAPVGVRRGGVSDPPSTPPLGPRRGMADVVVDAMAEVAAHATGLPRFTQTSVPRVTTLAAAGDLTPPCVAVGGGNGVVGLWAADVPPSSPAAPAPFTCVHMLAQACDPVPPYDPVAMEVAMLHQAASFDNGVGVVGGVTDVLGSTIISSAVREQDTPAAARAAAQAALLAADAGLQVAASPLRGAAVIALRQRYAAARFGALLAEESKWSPATRRHRARLAATSPIAAAALSSALAAQAYVRGAEGGPTLRPSGAKDESPAAKVWRQRAEADGPTLRTARRGDERDTAVVRVPVPGTFPPLPPHLTLRPPPLESMLGGGSVSEWRGGAPPPHTDVLSRTAAVVDSLVLGRAAAAVAPRGTSQRGGRPGRPQGGSGGGHGAHVRSADIAAARASAAVSTTVKHGAHLLSSNLPLAPGELTSHMVLRLRDSQRGADAGGDTAAPAQSTDVALRADRLAATLRAWRQLSQPVPQVPVRVTSLLHRPDTHCLVVGAEDGRVWVYMLPEALAPASPPLDTELDIEDVLAPPLPHDYRPSSTAGGSRQGGGSRGGSRGGGQAAGSLPIPEASLGSASLQSSASGGEAEEADTAASPPGMSDLPPGYVQARVEVGGSPARLSLHKARRGGPPRPPPGTPGSVLQGAGEEEEEEEDAVLRTPVQDVLGGLLRGVRGGGARA